MQIYTRTKPYKTLKIFPNNFLRRLLLCTECLGAFIIINPIEFDVIFSSCVLKNKKEIIRKGKINIFRHCRHLCGTSVTFSFSLSLAISQIKQIAFVLFAILFYITHTKHIHTHMIIQLNMQRCQFPQIIPENCLTIFEKEEEAAAIEDEKKSIFYEWLEKCINTI